VLEKIQIWTQVETGSAVPGNTQVVFVGNDSQGEFYSVALTNNLSS
jgi:Fe-S cluster assembly protein SufB